MLKKRKIRELAMQTLFAWDAEGARDDAVAQHIVSEGAEEADIRDAAKTLAAGAWENRAIADAWIERLAPQWPPRRQPGVDRNLLRLAVWELTSNQTPPKVVLDEAIEMAKHFSTEQSPAFINGVLDAILREHQALTAEPPPAAPPAAEPPPPAAPTAE